MICAEGEKRFAQIVLPVRKPIVKTGMTGLHKKSPPKMTG